MSDFFEFLGIFLMGFFIVGLCMIIIGTCVVGAARVIDGNVDSIVIYRNGQEVVLNNVDYYLTNYGTTTIYCKDGTSYTAKEIEVNYKN